MFKQVIIKTTEVLSKLFFTFSKVSYQLIKIDGTTIDFTREVYNTSNGVTVLLYNKSNKTVILTKQFRLPTYLNDNTDGMMVETCAGIIDNFDDPEVTIIREIEEETGYKIKEVKKLFELFPMPGTVTEKLHFFIAEYQSSQKIGLGGGLEHEKENIEVLELTFEEAYKQIETGEIQDAKTVILLQYAKINLFN